MQEDRTTYCTNFVSIGQVDLHAVQNVIFIENTPFIFIVNIPMAR
jgi:hypothetical protein